MEKVNDLRGKVLLTLEMDKVKKRGDLPRRGKQVTNERQIGLC